MPTGLGHFIIGFAIIIPILYYSNGEFNKKVAAIFIINNWMGPDVGQAFGFLEELTGIDFHWFIPWIVFAIPLALVFSYMSRFSIERSDRFFKIVDDGRKEVSWKNAYLLCAAGGLLHTIADAIFRHNTFDSTIKFLDDVVQPTLGDLYFIANTGADVGILQLLPFLIMIIIILFAVYIVDRDIKSIIIFFTVFCALTLTLTLVFGDKIVGEEYEVAVVFLSVIFVFLPLMFLFYADKDVRNNPTVAPEKKRISPETGLKIVGIITILLAVALLLLGIIGLTNPSIIQGIVDVGESLIIAIGIVVICCGVALCIAGIGIFLKKKFSRYILMPVCALLVIFVYPLIIFFYLNQNDLKQLFE